MASQPRRTTKRTATQILSWNVNGLRAVGRNGFFDWLADTSPDVLCLQEIKCVVGDLEDAQVMPLGFRSYWHSAEKPGYSGVAIYTKHAPVRVIEGIGVPDIDREGRVLSLEFETCIVVNAYFPNSQREHERLPYKLHFCAELEKFLKKLRQSGKPVLLCGDYNVAHREIDLRNPKTNVNNAGFLPAERAWMDAFLSAGWTDTFRHFVREGDHYTWWSYRPGVRERNIGWRIDYFCVSSEAISKVKDAFIWPDVIGSDHCPVGVEWDGEL
ncbi:MAG TPA: exodeoxyribonuclease III [Oligoflexia bacterium]|nr:exodeoxyribonuclease III [Oligoflexia bacterium]